MLKAIALSFFSLLISTSAIVVQNYSIAEAPPSSAGQNLDWSYVYHYNGSSAVAVGGSWLLTAAHAAGTSGSVTVSDSVYSQQEVVYHDSADLALVRFDKAFPGSYTLYTGSLTNAVGPLLDVIMVGYGTIGSTLNYSWTDNGSGRGTKRWGTQKIDREARHIYQSYDNMGFWMDFDLINTAYEAGTGTGDSGSGVFYNDAGAWKLAGINTERPQVGGDYRTTFAVAMTDYAEWIAETVPEPVTTGLMGLGTFGLFLIRAGQREKMAGRSFLRKAYLCDLFFIQQEKEPWFQVEDNLTGWWDRILASVTPVWERISSRYKKVDAAFWSHMVAVHERKVARRQAARTALKLRSLAWLDACLERLMK